MAAVASHRRASFARLSGAFALAAALISLVACGSGGTGSRHASPSSSPSSQPIQSNKVSEQRLIFATKSGSQVTVWSHGLVTGNDTVLFNYVEAAEATNSGGSEWEGLPPSIDLSKRGVLVYAAFDGLFTLDLNSGARHTLIARLTPGNEDVAAATWKPDLIGDALASPQWFSSRYVSFETAFYEGSSIAFFDTQTQRVFYQQGLPRSALAILGHLGWAQETAMTVVPRSDDINLSQKPLIGLYVSAVGDPTRSTFIPVKHKHVCAAALSPDGTEVAFTFSDDLNPHSYEGLALISRDGGVERIIDKSGAKSPPDFGPNGDLWWVEGGAVMRWQSSAERQMAQLDRSFQWEIQWIDREGIFLIGRSSRGSEAELVKIDLEGRTSITHKASTNFTTYLGLL